MNDSMSTGAKEQLRTHEAYELPKNHKLVEIQEGRFANGMVDGFARIFNVEQGHCEIGYFSEG